MDEFGLVSERGGMWWEDETQVVRLVVLAKPSRGTERSIR